MAIGSWLVGDAQVPRSAPRPQFGDRDRLRQQPSVAAGTSTSCSPWTTSVCAPISLRRSTVLCEATAASCWRCPSMLGEPASRRRSMSCAIRCAWRRRVYLAVHVGHGRPCRLLRGHRRRTREVRQGRGVARRGPPRAGPPSAPRAPHGRARRSAVSPRARHAPRFGQRSLEVGHGAEHQVTRPRRRTRRRAPAGRRRRRTARVCVSAPSRPRASDAARA
jgi:hypothetical protein